MLRSVVVVLVVAACEQRTPLKNPSKSLPQCPPVCTPGTRCVRLVTGAECMRECKIDQDCDMDDGERCLTTRLVPFRGEPIQFVCVGRDFDDPIDRSRRRDSGG